MSDGGSVARAGTPVARPARSHPGGPPSVLARGDLLGRTWQFDLLGAPIEPADRQYLPSAGARPLLTGFAWSVRLDLSCPDHRPRPSPYSLTLTIRPPSSDPGGLSQQFHWKSPGLPTDDERHVVWRLITPDLSTGERLARDYPAFSRTQAIIVTADLQVIWVPPDARILTEWESGGPWVSTHGPLRVSFEVDSLMRWVRAPLGPGPDPVRSRALATHGGPTGKAIA